MPRSSKLVLILIALTWSLSACSGPSEEPNQQGQADATGTSTATASATQAEPESTSTATATVAEATFTAPPRPTITPQPIPVFLPTATREPVPGPDPSQVWTIRRFDIEEPLMVLTFDAGADRGFAAEILNFLAEKDVRATFGMTGAWAEANPDLIQRIVREGHDLINHSWSHPDFTTISSAERADQLARVDAVIIEQTGRSMKPYFRPPFGAYNEAVLQDLLANGYNVNVMWTTDTLGWNGLSAAEINQRVFNDAVPGGIVLMHVGAASQDAAALPEMIDTLRAMGYSFATITELVQR